MSPRSLATGLGLLLGGSALVLQFWLSMSARLGQGHDLLNAVLWFFTYFTILTNLFSSSRSCINSFFLFSTFFNRLLIF